MNTGTETAPVNVTVNTRFSAVSPQISFNFGARDGWSYISGGIGRGTLTTQRVDEPLPDPESGTKTINYGGGARWFAKKHLAVTFDHAVLRSEPAGRHANAAGVSTHDAHDDQRGNFGQVKLSAYRLSAIGCSYRQLMADS